MPRFIVAVLVAAAAAAGSGCAIGQQIPYHVNTPRLHARGSGSIALSVQDERPEVRSGARPPNFCGFLRSGLGIPYQVTTASNGPLASDLASVVARGLRGNGFRVVVVDVPPNQSEAATFQALASRATDLSLLIHITQWKSDTYMSTSLAYRATAQVRDRRGQVIAQSLISGTDDLGSDFMDPGSKMKEVVPTAAREDLEHLLNNPSIAKALASVTASAPGAPTPTPTPTASGPDS